uniref:Uncharacterized protein n=1 Tax=Arundo donax TaxID=35708 RepID=A0A0A9CEU9_ARUDO
MAVTLLPSSTKSTTWLSFSIASSPTARARICCNVMRLMTLVTGSPRSAAGVNVSNLMYQEPEMPSTSPLMRSPVTQPARMTSSATPMSMASSAASALLWIWMGPRYCPSPRTALMSRSNTVTSYPFRLAASANTSPPMPPPATSTRGFRLASPAGAVCATAAASGGRIAADTDHLARARSLLPAPPEHCGCGAESACCGSSWQRNSAEKCALAGEVAESSAMMGTQL